MGTTTKQELTELVNDHHDPEFVASDEDMKMVQHIIKCENTTAEEVVDIYVRVDTKTKNLLHKGWILYGDEYYGSDEDALESLREVGVMGFHELDDDNPDSYYTDWWEGEIPA